MKTEKIDAYQALQNQLDQLKETVKNEFNENLRSIFEAFPELNSLSLRVSNHEFNDGDATIFSVDYESMIIYVNDEEIERRSYGNNKNSDHPILSELYSLFEKYDSLMEYMFGDEYKVIHFSRNSVVS